MIVKVFKFMLLKTRCQFFGGKENCISVLKNAVINCVACFCFKTNFDVTADVKVISMQNNEVEHNIKQYC